MLVEHRPLRQRDKAMGLNPVGFAGD
jgi:hypothetical protein